MYSYKISREHWVMDDLFFSGQERLLKRNDNKKLILKFQKAQMCLTQGSNRSHNISRQFSPSDCALNFLLFSGYSGAFNCFLGNYGATYAK